MWKKAKDEAKKWLNELIDLDNYLDECKMWALQGLLYKGNTCTWGNHAEFKEECRKAEGDRMKELLYCSYKDFQNQKTIKTI